MRGREGGKERGSIEKRRGGVREKAKVTRHHGKKNALLYCTCIHKLFTYMYMNPNVCIHTFVRICLHTSIQALKACDCQNYFQLVTCWKVIVVLEADQSQYQREILAI